MHIERLILGDLQTNCYIVSQHENSHRVILIDPADEAGRILHHVNGRKIEGVFLTHGHFDHTGALHAFEGLPIYLHEEDAHFLSDAHYGTGGFPGIDYDARPEATHLLRDGEEVHPEGFETPIQVLHTPGHTPGSCVYKMGDDLFTGDTLFCRGYGRCDLPGGDFATLVGSLRKLLNAETDARVYPGHGSFTTLFQERGRS